MDSAMNRVRDQVKVITSYASGIGNLNPTVLTRQGASVLIDDINEGLGAESARGIAFNEEWSSLTGEMLSVRGRFQDGALT